MDGKQANKSQNCYGRIYNKIYFFCHSKSLTAVACFHSSRFKSTEISFFRITKDIILWSPLILTEVEEDDSKFGTSSHSRWQSCAYNLLYFGSSKALSKICSQKNIHHCWKEHISPWRVTFSTNTSSQFNAAMNKATTAEMTSNTIPNKAKIPTPFFYCTTSRAGQIWTLSSAKVVPESCLVALRSESLGI